MTREHKLALIIGFSVFMVVGVLVGDYFSKARLARVDPGLAMSGETAAPAPMQADPVLPLPAPPAAAEHGNGKRVDRAAFPGPVELDMSGNAPLAKADVVGSADETPETFVRGTRETGPSVVLPAVVDTSKPYVVREKDTLIGIARKNYDDEKLWQKILEYNKAVLKGPDALAVGMTIRLPTKDALLGKTATQTKSSSIVPSAPAGKKTEVKSPATGKGLAFRTYKVEKGDTLGNISAKMLRTAKRVADIERLNPGIDSSSLRVGMEIKVPVS